MQAAAFILAGFGCLAAAASAVEMAVGNRRLRLLKHVPPAEKTCGRVSIIVAARNEERHIAGAIQTLIGQAYSDLEIIAVDDRSTDRTGAILDKIAQGSDRLKVAHLSELPKGWLGKNHALHTGASQASGALLLFTDADVIMDATAVGRAVGYMHAYGIDHLPVAPGLRGGGFLITVLIGAFLYLFTLAKKPWLVTRARSPFHMGIGAFNLITAEAYRKVGGHTQIALRPDDDMMLGKLVKTAGLRQEMLVGRDLIELEWYASCREMMRGLEKNAFAGLGYSAVLALLTCVAVSAVIVWPPVAVFLTAGWVRALNLTALAIWTLSYADQTRLWKAPMRHAVFFPVGTALLIIAIVRAVAKTLTSGGIQWRGHFYRLRDLKKCEI
jgi:hypothetical protein